MLRPKNAGYLIWFAAALIIAAAFNRYLYNPTFWLDESFVAASLRSPTVDSIFSKLEYSQYFPRIYLSLIALLRLLFGYHEWILRLLPFTCFVIATIIWARLLTRSARSFWQTNLLAAALLLSSFTWIDQAIQLKQYTFDVMLALLPFLITDNDLSDTFTGGGKRKWRVFLLAVPCALSYTYPIAFGGRVIGWLIYYRPDPRSFRSARVALFGSLIAASMTGIWFTDHRYNIGDISVYHDFWAGCILNSCFNEGPWCTLRIFGKFFWGWHGRLAVVTAIVAPFQIIGFYSIIRRLLRPKHRVASDRSISPSSVAVLASAITASVLASYPICSGRLTLFLQIHTQIIALEGVRYILTAWRRNRVVRYVVAIALFAVSFECVRGYISFVGREPTENIHPLYSLIDRRVSNTVWIHPCSSSPVKSLSTPLPVDEVLFAMKQRPQTGQKVWILWTHMGADDCKRDFELMRRQTRDWQIITETDARGLALAEYCCPEK